MKNKILVLLFSVAFLLTSCSNDEIQTNTTTSSSASAKMIGQENTIMTDDTHILLPDENAAGSWNDCTNTYTLTGSCTLPGNFSGFFKFDGCKKYKVTFSHSNQTISGLTVTLPATADGVTYSFITPKAWTYNATTEQFIITIPIKKTESHTVYGPPPTDNTTTPFPPTGATVVTTVSYFYRTLMVNTCTSTVSPS